MKRKKKELTKNGKQGKAFRREVTKHIAKAESRQEFEPLVGKIIDRAKVEPPHLKNSAWQLFVMKHALSLSDVSNCETVHGIPPTSVFGRYYSCIRFTIKATRLTKKIRKWLEERMKNQDLE